VYVFSAQPHNLCRAWVQSQMSHRRCRGGHMIQNSSWSPGGKVNIRNVYVCCREMLLSSGQCWSLRLGGVSVVISNWWSVYPCSEHPAHTTTAQSVGLLYWLF